MQKLAKEWDYEKNEFGPHEVLPNTNKKFGDLQRKSLL